MASVTVSSVLGQLTSSNTVSQIMGDVNSLKSLSAHAPSYVANSEFQSFVANTNTYIASVDGSAGLAAQTARIDLLNTNLTATNTAIRNVISTEVTNLVDSAPGSLDTLNELAAALGDDANFASTVTAALANKADSTTVSAVSTVANSALQPADAAGLSVDDADKLDGEHGTHYRINIYDINGTLVN